VNIRRGETGDAILLSELGAKTFFDTFAKDNTTQDIDSYLKQSFSPEIQLAELSSSDTIFIIAEIGNTPVGYAQLILGSREDLMQGARPMEIRRIYALQEFIGQGIGSGLMKSAIEEARTRGCDCVWLGVWEQNPRAIAFYKKWGFCEVGRHTFMLGSDPQTDLIMVLPLI
jgi:ribosomal protein S18 acetylase RimI-like enzyme